MVSQVLFRTLTFYYRLQELGYSVLVIVKWMKKKLLQSYPQVSRISLPLISCHGFDLLVTMVTVILRWWSELQ